MARRVPNPYWFDTGDQSRCAICREQITQPKRGPARIFCAKSACRRAATTKRHLADAWDRGYRAGAQGLPAPPRPPDPTKRHWSTAFQAGGKAAKLAVLETMPALETAVDHHRRYPTPDTRKEIQHALADMRRELRVGTRTEEPPPT